METIVEGMGTTAVAMATTAETTGIMATTVDIIDTTGMVTTMDITVTGGRGSMALAGVIHGTPGMGAMDIPITALTTIRAMATHMGAITAATTAAPTTAMATPTVQE
jgi:acetylornithine deacetylase/succinyl-diaminopimelate desuccinylase-like protein